MSELLKQGTLIIMNTIATRNRKRPEVYYIKLYPRNTLLNFSCSLNYFFSKNMHFYNVCFFTKYKENLINYKNNSKNSF